MMPYLLDQFVVDSLDVEDSFEGVRAIEVLPQPVCNVAIDAQRFYEYSGIGPLRVKTSACMGSCPQITKCAESWYRNGESGGTH